METIFYPDRKDFDRLCSRNIPADDPGVTAAVESIVADVAVRGDEALREYALRFDGVSLDSFELTPAEIDEGASRVDGETARAIDAAAGQIRIFHEAQRPAPLRVESIPGVVCEQRPVPIRTGGLYIPGGRAPLFSTVLMLGIPARIAGCRNVVMCTPQSGSAPIAPEILYAARVAGIDKIYRIGGAQAVAAMAYGTASVPRVDKIFGPGNRFVTKAKQLVTSVTAIDMPAGPSEVMVLADHTARPDFIASDMLSQAEHGPDSQAMLVTNSPSLAEAVVDEVGRQSRLLSRAESVAGSLSSSRIIVTRSREEAIDFANMYAAEHLIINMENPREAAMEIDAAGSVFIGPYSPESAGDYASGTNHTLPTGGWARSMSGVNLESFMRRITYQQLTPDGLASLAPVITAMAEAEGLDAHAAAVTVRLKSFEK